MVYVREALYCSHQIHAPHDCIAIVASPSVLGRSVGIARV